MFDEDNRHSARLKRERRDNTNKMMNQEPIIEEKQTKKLEHRPFDVGNIVTFGGFPKSYLVVLDCYRTEECESGWLVDARAIPCPICEIKAQDRNRYDSGWFKIVKHHFGNE